MAINCHRVASPATGLLDNLGKVTSHRWTTVIPAKMGMLIWQCDKTLWDLRRTDISSSVGTFIYSFTRDEDTLVGYQTKKLFMTEKIIILEALISFVYFLKWSTWSICCSYVKLLLKYLIHRAWTPSISKKIMFSFVKANWILIHLLLSYCYCWCFYIPSIAHENKKTKNSY